MALPSLSAIKYTVMDNKTADINHKNCSLSSAFSLTSETAKIIKRWYHIDIIDNMMVAVIPFL